MNLDDMPTIAAGTYGLAAYNAGLGGLNQLNHIGLPNQWQVDDAAVRRITAPQQVTPTSAPKKETAPMTAKTALRVIQVFVADPDQKLPADKRLLYMGQIVPTDATDEELFYELGIKDMLDKHNAVRTATKDKTAKNTEKDVFLEPIRVRDLVMTVVTLASFPERAPAA